jgi:hypothetical protein
MLHTALSGPSPPPADPFAETDPVILSKLAVYDARMVETIRREMLDSSACTVSWSDIAGLEFAKQSVRQVVVNPMNNPRVFTGLRAPPKGMLLFGPRQHSTAERERERRERERSEKGETASCATNARCPSSLLSLCYVAAAQPALARR